MVTKKSPFDTIFKELKKYEGQLSKSAQKGLQTLFNSLVKKVLKRKFRFLTRSLTERLTKAYRSYIKNGYKLRNKGIKGWRLDALKPELRKELKKRIATSVDYVSLNTKDISAEMNRRFLGFLTSTDRSNARESLSPVSQISRKDKHTQRVIIDQTRKMIGNFDRVVANHYQAIAFIWNGREDKREAGNPTGLYPDADPNSDVHGDHWSRNNKLYFYENSWVIKEGLVDRKKIKLAKFKDGMPSEPINCRCWAYNLYDLEDIYEREKNLVSKKGIEWLANKGYKI